MFFPQKLFTRIILLYALGYHEGCEVQEFMAGGPSNEDMCRRLIALAFWKSTFVGGVWKGGAVIPYAFLTQALL